MVLVAVGLEPPALCPREKGIACVAGKTVSLGIGLPFGWKRQLKKAAKQLQQLSTCICTITYLLTSATAALVRCTTQLHCSKMPRSITLHFLLFANRGNIHIMLSHTWSLRMVTFKQYSNTFLYTKTQSQTGTYFYTCKLLHLYVYTTAGCKHRSAVGQILGKNIQKLKQKKVTLM